MLKHVIGLALLASSIILIASAESILDVFGDEPAAHTSWLFLGGLAAAMTGALLTLRRSAG